MMSSRDDSSTESVEIDGAAFEQSFLAELPALARIADVETSHLMNLDSADMEPAHWLAIAREVHAHVARGTYDGVVVVHGTDTMAYSASALGLLLGELPCPVVLTGAQRPLASPRTDARENLIDAVHVATLAVPEVSVVFASRALRGVRSTKRDAWGFAAFDSPSAPALVDLGLGVDVHEHVLAAGPLAPLDTRLETRVLAVRVFPGLDAKLLLGALRAGMKGLVLEAYGAGTVPSLGTSLLPVLREARAMGIPVAIVSQCFRGFVDLTRYPAGREAADLGAMPGGDMTVEAALAKMMIALGRHAGDDQALRAYMASNVRGERAS